MADVQLTWSLSPTSSSDVDGQRIYLSAMSNPSFPGDYTEIASVGDSVTSYTDTGASLDGYTYAVTAFNSAGESSPTTDVVFAAGDRLDTVVRVDSTFTTHQTQTIELRIEDGGTTVHTDTQDVTLADSSDSQQITLSWQTASGDAGTYDMVIESEDDTITKAITVSS
jgi:hypothetical protein